MGSTSGPVPLPAGVVTSIDPSPDPVEISKGNVVLLLVSVVSSWAKVTATPKLISILIVINEMLVI